MLIQKYQYRHFANVTKCYIMLCFQSFFSLLLLQVFLLLLRNVCATPSAFVLTANSMGDGLSARNIISDIGQHALDIGHLARTSTFVCMTYGSGVERLPGVIRGICDIHRRAHNCINHPKVDSK